MSNVFTFDEIFEAVCEITGEEQARVLGSNRSPRIVYSKTLIVGLARELVGKIHPDFGKRSPSFPEIAQAMGKRTHSSTYTCYKRWGNIEIGERVRLRELALHLIHKARFQAINTCW